MGTAIQEVTTGRTFVAINIAVQELGIYMPTILRSLNSGKPLSKGPNAGMKFEYVDKPKNL